MAELPLSDVTPERRVTIAQVAAVAGVAVSTVSFVLNGGRTRVPVSPSTRDRVLRAASSLGYRPNELARAMVRGRTRMIAFFVPSIADEWIGRLLHGFVTVASHHGYFAKIVSLEAVNESETVARVLDTCPAAIVCHELLEHSARQIAIEARRRQVPCGCAGFTETPGDWAALAAPDTFPAVAAVVDHLADLGHRRIAHVAGNGLLASAVQRQAAYEAAMATRGWPVQVEAGDYSIAAATRAVERLLASRQPPTALFCANDPMALVALRVARRMGRTVPGDLAVVGYSNLLMSRLSDPELTTVDENLTECGRALAEAMVTLIDRNAEAPRHRTVPSELIVRQSTAAPAHLDE